jgi:trans-aconitate methyltransferase
MIRETKDDDLGSGIGLSGDYAQNLSKISLLGWVKGTGLSPYIKAHH